MLWFRLRCANVSRHERVVIIIIKTQWHCFNQTALRLACPSVSLGADYFARVCVLASTYIHVDWFHCQQHAARLTLATFSSVCVAHNWLCINVHLMFCQMLDFIQVQSQTLFKWHQWLLLIFAAAIDNMFYFVYGKKHTLQLTACCCTAIKGNSISCTQLYV